MESQPGKLITLRKFKRSDAANIAKYANDKRIARWMPAFPFPYTENDGRQWVGVAHRVERKGHGYHFAIEYKETGELIGGIGLRNVNRVDSHAEFGYWVARKFWGKGIATEASYLILKFSFKKLGLRRVYATVFEGNHGSVRVLEKCGLTLEGTERKAKKMGRKWVDVYHFGILREEYK